MAKIELGLPPRPFLYTLDQIADLISLDLPNLKRSHVYFVDVTPGTKPPGKMLARNIGERDRPDWRVAEEELRRWLRHKGFRVYDRSQLRI